MPQPFEEQVAPVIRDDFDGWRQRLFTRVFPEPHSLKGIEDCIAWAGETTPDVLVESLRRHRRHQCATTCSAACACRRSRSTAPTTRSCPYTHAQKIAEAIPGHAWSPSSGAATACFGARRGEGEPADPRLRPRRDPSPDDDPGHDRAGRPGRRAPSPAARRAAASAGCCGSPARSASATSSATSPSPSRCASGIRTSRSTSSPPIPPTASSSTGASGSIRRRGSCRTRARTSRAGRRTTSCTRSTRSGTWTRS